MALRSHLFLAPHHMKLHGTRAVAETLNEQQKGSQLRSSSPQLAAAISRRHLSLNHRSRIRGDALEFLARGILLVGEQVTPSAFP